MCLLSGDPKIPEGFELKICTSEDQAEVCRIFIEAMRDDQLWKSIICNVTDPAKVFSWVSANFAPRWYLPDVILYKITDNESKRIAGWAAIQIPWKFRENEMTEQLKKQATCSELPPIDDEDKTPLSEYVKILKASATYGYNPEEDYHRLGTMILPEYQKRGLGTFFTRYCAQISDLAPARQWVPARPSSAAMFKKNGFVEVGNLDHHLERFGGTRACSKSYVFLRSIS